MLSSSSSIQKSSLARKNPLEFSVADSGCLWADCKYLNSARIFHLNYVGSDDLGTPLHGRERVLVRNKTFRDSGDPAGHVIRRDVETTGDMFDTVVEIDYK